VIYELPPGRRDADGIDFSNAVPITCVPVPGSRFISMGRNYGGPGVLGFRVKRGGVGQNSNSGNNKKRVVDHEQRNHSKNRRRNRG
jgi:hypothetical protein